MNEGRVELLKRAQEGGPEWVAVAYIWPELDACYCQGTQPDGTLCVKLRLQQVEVLFAKDDSQ